jgi:hypothetical protein
MLGRERMMSFICVDGVRQLEINSWVDESSKGIVRERTRWSCEL